MTYLSVVIPAYNEAKRIGKTIKIIKEYLNKKQFSYEIIVVDDGSKDDTKEVVNKLGGCEVSSYSVNRGKGFAVKQGALAARGDLILFSDADLSTPIKELDNFLKYIDNYDVIIGSRGLKESDVKIKQPFYREYSGKLFNKIVRLITGLDIHDTQCGFKLFKHKAAKEIFCRQTIYGFGFDVEILYIAKNLGYKIKELPVEWYNDKDTKVKLTDPFKMLKEVIQVRLKKYD